VIDMELLRVIHRWRYLDHVSIREISLRAGLARNRVRKYLSSRSAEPKFNLPDRASKLDRFAKKASQMLWQEVGKSQKAEADNQAIAR
jgi:transcriptional regulator with XRE-family HTH domain